MFPKYLRANYFASPLKRLFLAVCQVIVKIQYLGRSAWKGVPGYDRLNLSSEMTCANPNVPEGAYARPSTPDNQPNLSIATPSRPASLI